CESILITDQGGADQQNVSQESGFEQVEEDAHLLNLENPSLADNEIASLMDTTVRHEEPRSQTSSLYTVPVTATPEVTSVFTITIPPPPPFFNPLPQQATPTPTPTTSEATTSFPSLLDFSFVFKFNDKITNLEKDLSEIKQVDPYAQALSSIPAIVDRYIDNKLGEAIQKAIVAHNLDCREEAQAEKRDYIELADTSMRVILKEEKNVTKSLEDAVLARSSSQPKSTYEAAASLSKFELTTILIDKMEKNKSYDKADYKRELYDALVKSYQTDKYLFDTYGEVFMLKRSRDDRDKDQDPSAGSDRGTKRRKSSKEAESSRDPRSKEKKSSSTSKDASHSQQKPSGKSAHAEEPSHTVDDSGVQQDQEFDTGNNDEQPADKEVSKADWFKKPERPPTPDSDWNKRQHVDFRPPQTWISQVAHAKEPRTSFDELMDTSFDFSAFVLNRLNIKDLNQEILNVPRLPLNDLTDITLKANRIRLISTDCHSKAGEDLHLGVESYQKKLSITKPDTIRSNLRNRTTYTAYSDLKGVIYKDQNNRNRLMRADELHKISDGTLNDVRTALYDIAKGIRMEYLPKRKWSGLDKRRAWVMVQDIDKQLYERRLMRNLEKFVGGREYGNDLRLLKRTI
ncbi:hypothetical protein Tco_0803597, partial [Tanacetum coccineum]